MEVCWTFTKACENILRGMYSKKVDKSKEEGRDHSFWRSVNLI